MIASTHPEDRICALSGKCRSFFAGRKDSRIIASFLYGSVQTASWRLDSDVDIAVLDDPGDRLTWAQQAVVMDELERLTGLPIDLRMLRDCQVSHQAHILTRGTLLWVSGPEILEEYQQSVLKEFQGSIPAVHQSWVTLLDRLVTP